MSCGSAASASPRDRRERIEVPRRPPLRRSRRSGAQAEIANIAEPLQDGRIHIERINAAFLAAGGSVHLHPSVMRPVHGTVLISAGSGGSLFSWREDRKVKKTIIALSAAVLIAAAPAAFAKGVTSKTPSVQHKVSRKHHPGVTNYALRREMQLEGRTMGYPRAFGYAPSARPVERWLAPDQAPGGAGATPGPGGGNTSVTTGQQAFGANGNPDLPVPNLSGTGPSTSGGGAGGGGGGGGGGNGR
jgi:hypothetical protein